MTEPADITVSENQRLKKEVRDLRERVNAFEGSRWWRLHPRFVLGRVLRNRSPNRDQSVVAVQPPRDDKLTSRFRLEVVDRGRFTEDWFTVHIPEWEAILRRFERRSARVLELGSYEGLSACFVLWRLADAQITCVDLLPASPATRPTGSQRPSWKRDSTRTWRS